MKDPHVVSFSPMFHWTEPNITVHVLTCVLALQVAHLLRLQAQRAGLRMSVRELLTQLAGIGETVLIYPAARGRPKVRRMLTISPRTIQSGARSRAGHTGKGNPCLKGILGEAAAAAGKTGTFPGERCRRLARRRGKLKALAAIARSILVIVWHLLADRSTRYCDLGADYHASRIDKTARPAATSVSSKPSATPSPSPRQPDHSSPITGRATSRLRRRCRAPGWGG